jgi:two-component sensor histidine kinase
MSARPLEGQTLLNHRIKNELASIINFVSFKAIWTDNVEAKKELTEVVDLLHRHAEIHSLLAMPDRGALVDAGEQLRRLCAAMTCCKLDRMNIHLLCSVEALPLESERCWRLALAVYELVTNAVRHACFDSRDGAIKVKLRRAGSWVDCLVTDNGAGQVTIRPGQGLRIVNELANSLSGRIDRTSGATSNSFSLDFPLTEREQRANRVVAARRPRTRHRLQTVPSSPSMPAAGERPPLFAIHLEL